MKEYKERLPLIDEAIDKLDGEWPHSDLNYLLEVTSKNAWACAVKQNKYLCTRQEFEQRVKELRNKPSWKDAPMLANYLSQDIDGQWWFHQHKPIQLNCGEWRQGGNHYAMGKGKVIGDWKSTLEEREAMENKNDWHEKGELPPVRSTHKDCRLVGLGYSEPEFEVTAHHYNGVTAIVSVKTEDGVKLHNAKHVHFNPLRSERDELIDEAKAKLPDHADIIGYWSLCGKVIEILADAGMLKKPEEE